MERHTKSTVKQSVVRATRKKAHSPCRTGPRTTNRFPQAHTSAKPSNLLIQNCVIRSHSAKKSAHKSPSTGPGVHALKKPTSFPPPSHFSPPLPQETLQLM